MLTEGVSLNSLRFIGRVPSRKGLVEVGKTRCAFVVNALRGKGGILPIKADFRQTLRRVFKFVHPLLIKYICPVTVRVVRQRDERLGLDFRAKFLLKEILQKKF